MQQIQEVKKKLAYSVSELAAVLPLSEKSILNDLSEVRLGKKPAACLPPFFKRQGTNRTYFFDVEQWVRLHQFRQEKVEPVHLEGEEKRKRGRKTNKEKARLASIGGGAA